MPLHKCLSTDVDKIDGTLGTVNGIKGGCINIAALFLLLNFIRDYYRFFSQCDIPPPPIFTLMKCQIFFA